MKALVVTSRVTFVPRNYDILIAGLADCPQVGGLLVLDNRSLSLVGKAAGLILIGARRIGWSLLRNALDSGGRRRRAYAARGKPAWMLKTINSPEAVELVKSNAFDVVVNARTRYIYKPDILRAPRLGCINIHHGLLPEQRGTMCDLWALHERGPAGFTIHQMNEKIDAGELVARVEVSDGSDRDYLAYLVKSCGRELETVQRVLAGIERQDSIAGTPNAAPPGLVHRHNPTREQIGEMKRGGLRL